MEGSSTWGLLRLQTRLTEVWAGLGAGVRVGRGGGGDEWLVEVHVQEEVTWEMVEQEAMGGEREVAWVRLLREELVAGSGPWKGKEVDLDVAEGGGSCPCSQ